VSLTRLHWGQASPSLLALWPSPMKYDACFASAGFNHFAGVDPAHGGELDAVAGRLLRALEKLGSAWTPKPLERRRSLTRKPSVMPVLAQLLVSIREDQLPPLTVHFGDPPAATIFTADGHPIFWLTLPAGFMPSLLPEVAAGLPVSETALDWARLLPYTIVPD
jgi:hypothetical protein